MSEMTDAARMAKQYDTEERLETRLSVWFPLVDGSSPQDVALAALRAAAPDSVLEVGCGTGAFAQRIAAEIAGARVVVTDQSLRFVALAAAQGLDTQVADIQDLPFDYDSFDAVAAMWMLYHVRDLDRGLAEVRRVLRPDGVFVAVTNGDAHLADLMVEAGGRPLVTQFSTENGEAALRRHFTHVTRDDIATRARFDDHRAAVAYLATFDGRLAANLPPFQGSRECAGATSVFVAA
jgi:SAM-dependent methyltransferase